MRKREFQTQMLAFIPGRLRPYHRGGAYAVMAAVVVWSMLGPASPAPARESREVKRVKKALVKIEHVLDEGKAEIDRIHGRLENLDAVVKSARLSLRVASRYRSPDLWMRLQFWEDIVRLVEARSEIGILEDRLPEAQQEIWNLTARRADKIDELKALVRISRAHTRNPLPSWSVHGNLITYSADWEAVSLCESSGRWHINSQYDGGLQFHPRTWIGFGGGEFARHAYEATKKQQIAVAERVLAIQGSQAWPNCFHPLPFNF
jgi:hypothetical protein